MVTDKIRPYNGEPYNLFPWGSAGYIDINTKIEATYCTNHTYNSLLYIRYSVFNRYKGTENNIEDIYSNVTRRALALGCMDGPVFAYFSNSEVE